MVADECKANLYEVTKGNSEDNVNDVYVLITENCYLPA
jgi:hypothetical protein